VAAQAGLSLQAVTLTEVVRVSAAARAIRVYADTYFDHNARLGATDRELRVRTVHGVTSTRSVLTYKKPRVGAVSGAKPERETVVADLHQHCAAYAALRESP
jgi:adenylate cyclase class 2